MTENIKELDLVGYIQTSIEILMKLKNDQEMRNIIRCVRCKQEITDKLKKKGKSEKKGEMAPPEEVKIDVSPKFDISSNGKVAESKSSSVLEAPEEYELLLR